MLTRAAEACLVKPNARKAYSLVLFELVLLRPRVRACESATVNSCTVPRGVVAGGQMSAIQAVVITTLGTAAAVVWALCLEAWRKKRAGHGREPGPRLAPRVVLPSLVNF